MVDATPSHPHTVLTSMTIVENYLKHRNVKYIYLSLDLVLYRLALYIKWSNMLRWQKFILRPGGMHTLMSFVGSIGSLMKGSGLEEIISVSFAGVRNIINGKAWPKALRSFRMVTAAILEPVVERERSPQKILSYIDAARMSKTSRLWIDCFLIPVSIMHWFVRAEREGNWPLHQHCLERMLPYLFAAGHWNYARYSPEICVLHKLEL